MKKKETRFNEFPINFDDDLYQSKASSKEKSDYIFSLLSTFFDNFNQFPILLTSQAIPPFQKFFDILPHTFESQNPQNLFSYIPRFLVCFQPYYNEIPHIELYMCVYDCVIKEYIQNPTQLYNETLKIFFQSLIFCKNFILSSRLNLLLLKNMPENENFEKLLNIINTQAFFEEIRLLENYKKFIIDLYNFVSDSKNIYSDQYFVIFLHFILSIIIKLFNYGQYDINSDLNSEKFLDSILFSTGIFDKINNFLIHLDDGEITWNTIHPIMLCSGDPNEIPYDLKIFLQLNKIFISDHFSLKSKKAILLQLLHDDVIFESPFCINQTQFPIHLFLTKECVCDEEFFSIYIKIIEKCISIDQSSALYSINKFIELLAPPITQNEILYEKVFEWMSKILNPANFPNSHPIDSSIFNDNLFYETLFINPEITTVDTYFNFPHFYEVFTFLFDSQRTHYHRKDIISRIFDLINLNHQKYINQYKMGTILLSNFEVNILNYYIDNISDKKVINVFKEMNNELFIRMPQLFRAGNTFSIIEKHMKEEEPKNCENYLRELLYFIQSIANNSQDMFFDEWVLTLPKESPIFKLQAVEIAPFVYSSSVIFIPSLVPLLQDFDFLSYSPYNHYLLGRYSVPVALKLGIHMANMSRICQHYISFDTYHHLMKTGEIVNLVKRSKKNEEVQCYEFFLGSLPGWIILPSLQSIVNETQSYFNSSETQNIGGSDNYVFVMFYVKFNNIPTNLFPFLHVSKQTFYVNEDYITYGENGKKKIKQIQSNVWYLIRMQKTKIMNWTEFYIDNKKELTLREPFNFEMIGDQKSQVTTSFFVAQNIYASTFTPENLLISQFNLKSQGTINPILNGGVVSAPIYSISNLLRENYTFLSNFDIFDEILSNSKAKKLTNNKSIKNFYVFLIQTADYLTESQLFLFYNRLLCSMMLNPEYFKQFHIIGLIQSILMLKNQQMRTTIFISILFNLELWHKLNINLLIDFVRYINNNEITDLDWPMIFTKQNFLYSIDLIYYANSLYKPEQFDKMPNSISDSSLEASEERKSSFDFDHFASYTPLFKEFFIFWEFTAKYLKTEAFVPVLRDLAELSCIPEMGHFNAKAEIANFNVKKALQTRVKLMSQLEGDTFDISIAICVKTVLFIQKIERNLKQSQIFTNEMLLYFSFFMPASIAQALFLSLLQIRCEENNSYVVERLPIISKISQRFCDSSLIWSLFISLLTGDKTYQVDLDSQNMKIEIPKKVECPQIFSILIELLISLSTKKNSNTYDSTTSNQSSFVNEQVTNLKKENALKLMAELFKMNEPIVLLEDANLPAFIHLISGRKFKDEKKKNNNVLKIHNYTLNIEALDLPDLISTAEMKILESKIIENKDLFQELIEQYSYQPTVNLTSEVGIFITSILVKIFIYLMDKKSNNRFQLYFSILTNLADERILRHALTNIFLYLSRRQSPLPVVNLLKSVLLNLLIKRKTVFNLKLFDSIIDFSTSFSNPPEQINPANNNNATNDNNNNNNDNENPGSGDESRKGSFSNDQGQNDYFKMLAPFFTVALYEIGKIDKKKTLFNKLAKKFLERSKLIIEEFQSISIILIYIFLYYGVEDFSNNEIQDFYQLFKENYVVTEETPLLWTVIDLTPNYKSLLLVVYFKVSASPSPSTSVTSNSLINAAEQNAEDHVPETQNENHIPLNETQESSYSTVDFASTTQLTDMIDSNSTSNFIETVRKSIEEFKKYFSNWESLFLGKAYVDLTFKDMPLDQSRIVLNNIAYNITREILIYFIENRRYYMGLNMRMRCREKLFSYFISKSITNKSQIGKLQCKSFRASSFAAPTTCPVVCMPSTFAIKTPQSNQNTAELSKTRSLPLKQSEVLNSSETVIEQSPLLRDETLSTESSSQQLKLEEQSQTQESSEMQQSQEQQETENQSAEQIHEPQVKEQQTQEPQQQEQTTKETPDQQQTQEQPVQEPLIKEQQTQEQQAQEQPAQEQPAQEQQAQEQQAQEQQAQEQPAQEQPAQEQQAQEQPAQEQPAQEQQAQEQPAQEQQAQEQPAQEQPAQEQPAQEQQAQEQQAQEQQAQEQQIQDQQAQEPLIQEQQKQEQQAQEQQTQEQPAQEQQKQEQPEQIHPTQEQQTQEQPAQTQPAQELQSQDLKPNQEANSSPPQRAKKVRINPIHETPSHKESPASSNDKLRPFLSQSSNSSSKSTISVQQPQESQYLSSLDLLSSKSDDLSLESTRHQVDFDCDNQLHNYYDIVAEHSKILNLEPINYFDQFRELYGDIYQYHQCTLIRQFFRIQCICFIMTMMNRCLILMDATSSKEARIKLLDPTPHLSESILMNEFGQYSMFCGHYVILVELDNIIMSTKFSSRAKNSSLLICSIANGNFVLEFLFFPIINPSDLNLSIKRSQQLWLEKTISTKDYLEILNFFGMRSFADFSAYPIFPRVIQDISKYIQIDDANSSQLENDDDKLASKNLRDLSKPIQIIGYDDKQVFINRFRMNQFHYFENLSNPISVSALNLRLAPFCYQQWFLTDGGWDQGERNFLSASPRLSATKKTIDELPPEMFCYPEILMNKNSFRLPNGKLFNLQFPEWCNCGHCNMCKKCGKNNGFSGCKKAAFFFIEYMRYALEHDDVRKNLNKWIDLNFGDKLMSEDELTVYHPLSVAPTVSNEGNNDVSTATKKLEDVRNWMLQCGQVPKKVFTTPHPQFETKKQLYTDDFNPLNFVFCGKEFPFMNTLNKLPMNKENSLSSGFAQFPPLVFSASISKDTVVNVRNNIEFVTNTKVGIVRKMFDISPSLFFKSHVEIQTDFIVITYSLSLICVYKIIKTEKEFFLKLTGVLSCTCFKKKAKNNKEKSARNCNFENESESNMSLNSTNDFLNYNHSFNGDGDIIDDNGVVDYTDIDDPDQSYIEEKPLFSTLHIKQFLCATICTNDVIIWSFSNSMVVARIDVAANTEREVGDDNKIEVITAKFDEEINVLYISTSNGELHQYSLNGQLIRKIGLKAAITAIEIIPSGFSVFSRFVVTGHNDGSARILKVDLKTREFVVVKEKNLFNLKVARIVPHRDSYIIDVYAFPSRLI